ncbi:hypothetical protein QL285_039986 [Trifolium repens]|nr:hypothetical protein QL285_039986 [Trifolium repens]
MKKEEVEMNVLRVLKRKVSDYYVALGVGAVFYVGDCNLNWIVNDESYNHVDYMGDEIGNFFCEEGDINGTSTNS